MGQTGDEGRGAALRELLETPVGLGEYRRRFDWFMAGDDRVGSGGVVDEVLAGDMAPELKARLQGMEPREWALVRPGLFRRFLSFVVDVPLFFIVIIIGAAIIQPLAAKAFGEESVEAAFVVVGWLGVAFVGYFVGSEWLLGASPGGFLTGLRVVDERGRRPGLLLCVKRQFMRVARIVGMLAIAKLSENASVNRKMARGGLIAGVGMGGGDEVVRA